MPNVKNLVASAMAAAGLAFASAASALVVEWDAAFENGFAEDASVSWQGTPVVQQGAVTVGGADAFSQLRWPILGNQSGLDVTPGVIGGGASKSVFTNGPTVDTVSITHLNRVVTCNQASPTVGTLCENALKDTVLLTHLVLTAVDPAGPPVDLGTIPIPIRFVETFNSAGNCALLPEQSGAPCVDIFVLLAPLELNFDFVYVDGVHYFGEINAEGVGPLSDNACLRAGVAPGCIGLVTMEGADTEILANIRIFTVPEPGTLAILALGLLAIGVVTRRKRAA